jgi:hypothetical protein
MRGEPKIPTNEKLLGLVGTARPLMIGSNDDIIHRWQPAAFIRKVPRMICTGMTVGSGNRAICLDDPKARQRYAKDMTPKQREKFAKFYVRKVLKAKEYSLWFNRMLKK